MTPVALEEDTSLAGRLAVYGIREMDLAMVKAHKAKMLREVRRPALFLTMLSLAGCIILAIFVSFVVAVCLVAVTLFNAVFGNPWMGDLANAGASFGIMLAGCVCAGLVLWYQSHLVETGKAPDINALWEKRELTKESYPQPLPSEIIKRFATVNQMMPEARLLIEQIARDPFLIVELDGEEVYIGLWDGDHLLF